MLDPNRLLARARIDLGRDVAAVVPARESAMPIRDVIVELIGPHHRYLYRAMPFLQSLAGRVASAHGDTEPSLVEVAMRFAALVALLRVHMAEEEGELFPALLEGRERDALPMLLAMRREHEEVAELLRELRRAARDYRPPGWASNSYRTLMYELRALEVDVREHLELEDRALLPRYAA